MTTTAIDATQDAATSVRTTVTAVVFAGTDHADLEPVLTALAAQSQSADQVIVLREAEDGASDARATFPGVEHPALRGRVTVRTLASQTSDRQAVTDLVSDLVSDLVGDGEAAEVDPEHTLLWLLPAGVVPEPDALARLAAAHRRSDAVAMTGPKILDAANPTLLRSAGIQATRSGRLVDDPVDGALDQSQHDTRRDVVAVPFAGALVRIDTLAGLHGWERSFGDVAADLDLGWRIHLGGRRVELVPEARLRARQGVGSASAHSGRTRQSARRVALVRASWWAAPVLALWIALTALLAGLALLLLKRPRAAAAELGALGALDPVRWVTVKVRTRCPVTLRRRHLAGLFVPVAELRRRIGDEVSEALFPGRSGALGAQRDEPGRSTLRRVVTNPGLLATLVVLGTLVAAGRTLGLRMLTGLGGGYVGGELVGGRADSAALWAAWSHGWSGAGAGHDGSGGPHLAALAGLTWIVEHLPGLGSLPSAAGATTAAVLLLTPVLASVSAYLASRVLTTRRWLRAAAGLTWATVGAAGPVYAAGRLGGAVALILIPLVLAGLALLARRDGTATAGWASALGIAVLAAFAPGVAGLLVLFALVLFFGLPTEGARARVLIPLLGAPAALLLWWPGLIGNWRQLLAGPGLAAWGEPAPDPWRMGLLDTGSALSPPWWAAVGLLSLGLLGLVRGRRVQAATSALAALGLLGLAGALLAPRLRLAPLPSLLGAGEVTAWTGSGLLVLGAALLGSAVLGLDALAGIRRERWSTAGRIAAVVFGVGMAGAAASGLVLTTLGAGLAPWTDPRPAVAIEHADGPLAGRTLFVSATATGPGFRLVGRETDGPARVLPVQRDQQAVAGSVSSLLGGGDESNGAQALRALAVGFVAVDGHLGDEMLRRLDATSGLTRLAARDGWQMWRVTPLAAGNDTPIGPPRVGVVQGEALRVVPVTGLDAATSAQVTAAPGATLRVAEPTGWAARARVLLDGHVLHAGSGLAGTVTYPLTGSGRLDIEVGGEPAWLLPVQLVGLAVLVFLAIPFGSRASRQGRPTRRPS